MYLEELEVSFVIVSKTNMKIIFFLSALFNLSFIVFADSFISFMTYISRAIIL